MRQEAVMENGNEHTAARRSVVRVFFETENRELSYFNDAFDLQTGDIVFVEGKLEGKRGRVTEVSYNFKIKLSDYKRVLSKADTAICGELFPAGSHLLSFDRETIPYEKIITWYKAPEKEEEICLTGSDDTSFALENLSGLQVSHAVIERGSEYYRRNAVRYLCLDGTRGRAIVEGTRPYEVEFRLADGRISGMVCDCFCSETCKHEVAVLLQLKECLKRIEERHAARYEESGCFAALCAQELFEYAVAGKKEGSIQFLK